MSIIISADSVCDLSEQLIDQHNIPIIPLLVGLGETYYEDGVNIVPDDIYQYVAQNKVLPKTAARGPQEYIDFFTKLTAGGDEVIHFSISADMSSSYQNARIAAAEVGNVHIVDSRSLSTGIALLILDACKMRAEGKGCDDILAEMERRIPLVRASFVVDTLDYLKMGGRCSSVAALGANMLRLHPRIDVVEGKMIAGTKYRGPMTKVIPNYAKDVLAAQNIRSENVFITHANCDNATVAAVRAAVGKLGIFKNIYETRAGSTINSHCGQGTLGVLFEVES